MQIRENVPISELTTMRLGGETRFLLTIENIDDVTKAYDFAREHNLPTWIMGDGANTIGRDEGYAGIILLNRIKGIEVIFEQDDEIILKGMAGEEWDDFVKYACERGYSGIEAMSMIPGTVGAAPVQNIGAYGQEASQVLQSVEAYDTKKHEFVTIPVSDMQIGYRQTRFNHGIDAGRFLITSITVKLRKQPMQPPFYNSLQRYIDKNQITDFSPMNIRKIVCEIRTEKLPDPQYIASAGSFFKNILLNRKQIQRAELMKIPIWHTEDGGGKVNSGWLIEQCGFKGKLIHGIRVSDKAALVLINESATSYADLDAARSEIISAVVEKFGYILDQEPVEIPV